MTKGQNMANAVALVRCTQTIQHGGKARWHGLPVNDGDLLEAGDPIVAAWPQLFEPVTATKRTDENGRVDLA